MKFSGFLRWDFGERSGWIRFSPPPWLTQPRQEHHPLWNYRSGDSDRAEQTMISGLRYLAWLAAAGTATLAPVGVRAGDPGTIMTEQSLFGCESFYVCGQPGLDRWSIDITVGGVGDLNSITDERTDGVHGSTIRGVAYAQFGKLGVSAFADPPEGMFGSGSILIPDQAEMRAFASYEDVLTVLGLPGASDAPLTVTQVLSGFVDPPFNAHLGVGFASLQTRVFIGGFEVGAPIVALSNTSTSPLLPATSTILVPVGTQLFVRQTLNVVAAAGSGGPPVNSVWLDTGVLHFDVEGPGTSIRSASGHDYSSPVPEPSTAAMVACGLLVLSGSRRLQPARRVRV